MPANRYTRRLNDSGLQPERTSLAWFRTLLGCGVMLALAVRNYYELAGTPFLIVIVILMLAWLLLYIYTRQRGLMDITHSDFSHWRSVGSKLLITLVVLMLALLFTAHHLLRLIPIIKAAA